MGQGAVPGEEGDSRGAGALKRVAVAGTPGLSICGCVCMCVVRHCVKDGVRGKKDRVWK